jgi:flagellar basal-body rod protein FlgB
MNPTDTGPADIGLFRLAEQRLAWVGRRQELLAQNVANASTPRYQPRDLPPFASALAHAGPAAAMVRTVPNHLIGASHAQAARLSRPRERAPDGNSVSMEDQLTKVADTAGTQQLVANLYRKYHGMFRTALGRAG